MAQCNIRSPDCKEGPSDGPPWHVDERFFYVNSGISFLSVSTEFVDIRDEIVYGDDLAKTHSSPAINVKSPLPCTIKLSDAAADWRSRKQTNASSEYSVTSSTKKEQDSQEQESKTTLQLGNLRQTAEKEHLLDSCRAEFYDKWTENSFLSKKEAKQWIQQKTGREFVFWHGGERTLNEQDDKDNEKAVKTTFDAEEEKREEEYNRAFASGVIHQGPRHVTAEFAEFGRVSFFFAVFDF